MALLSREAQGQFDSYLQRMRASLRGHTSIDVEDVERDVRGHIDAALAGQPEPIDAPSLAAVLKELGAPEQWVPDDDLPTWHQALSRRSLGPADWRVPALALICCIAGPVLFLVPVEGDNGIGQGPLLWPLPVVLPLVGFVVARAAASMLAAAGQSIDTRRWLLYPPLLVVYVPLAAALLLWPIAFVLAARADFPSVAEGIGALLPRSAEFNTAVTTAFGLGAWWMALGFVCLRYTNAIRTVFWPFAESVARPHAIGLMAVGGVLVTIASVVLIALR
jgi:hypothetical protein